MPEITLVQAVNLALARAMADDPSVLVVGEDVPVIVGPLEEIAFPVIMSDQGDALLGECGRFGHASSMPYQCCLTATPALSDRVHGVVARAAARPRAMR